MTQPAASFGRETPMTGLGYAALASRAWQVSLGQGLLFLLCFATTFNLTLRQESGEFSLDPLVLIRLAICGACGLYGLWYLPAAAGQLRRFPLILFPIYVAWSLITVASSPAKVYSLAAVLALASMVIFIPAVLKTLGMKRTLTTVAVSLLAFQIGSWLLFFLRPELGTYTDPLTGGRPRVGADANQLGLQSALALSLLAAMGVQRWYRWRALWPWMAVSLVTLYFTDSRTSWMAAALAAAVLGGFFLSRSGKTLITLTATAVVCGCLMFWPPDLLELARGSAREGNIDDILTLNGRTEIWEFSWKRCADAPWLGHGYGASRHALLDFTNSGYLPGDLHHAHNQVLNAWLCTGMIGAALVASMMGIALIQMLRRPHLMADVLVAIVLIAAVLEVVIFGPMPRVAAVLFFIAMAARHADAGSSELGSNQAHAGGLET